jgi:hypothetical protein
MLAVGVGVVDILGEAILSNTQADKLLIVERSRRS